MTAYDPRLLWNDEPNHASEILDRLHDADRFICMVAFAKESGFSILDEKLVEAVKRGMVATFVIGTDFYQSQPTVIEKLLKLKKHGDVDVYMGSTKKQYTFHPKLFLFEKGNAAHIVVGSANLTAGGLANNHELSVAFGHETSKVSPPVYDWISSLLSEGEIFGATPERVADYARRHAIYSRRMMLAHKQAERAAADPDGGVNTLAQILAEMKADQSHYGFDQSVARRAASAVEGMKILNEITQVRSGSSEEFLEQFNRLLVTFHSGGLRRGNSGVTKDRAAFIVGARSILVFEDQYPAALFDHLLGHFRSVNRAGTNLLTEILQLLDKKRFAVMNQNSVAGLKLAGHMNFPDMPSKQNMTGEMYADFCQKADKVRSDLGLADFSQLDALFNYAYWRREEAARLTRPNR